MVLLKFKMNLKNAGDFYDFLMLKYELTEGS